MFSMPSQDEVNTNGATANVARIQEIPSLLERIASSYDCRTVDPQGKVDFGDLQRDPSAHSESERILRWKPRQMSMSMTSSAARGQQSLPSNRVLALKKHANTVRIRSTDWKDHGCQKFLNLFDSVPMMAEKPGILEIITGGGVFRRFLCDQELSEVVSRPSLI